MTGSRQVGAHEGRDALLSVTDLRLEYLSRNGTVSAVRGIDLDIARGETVGLVGESGSGKSAMASAVMGLVELPGRICGGDITWKGRSIIRGDGHDDYLQQIRGREISMIFQDPMTSLDPLFTVGSQIEEVLKRHLKMGRKAARVRAAELLAMVGISSPALRLKQHPHELSGGMRQRVMIAMALACEPELLIADEPTTALDVTIQAQILDLLRSIQVELGLAVLLISHDLGVIAETCDRVSVMYAGRVCESSTTREIFARPRHPYTLGLLESTPRIDVVRPRLDTIVGTAPDMRFPPPGCAFEQRCPISSDECVETVPSPRPAAPGHLTACLHDERVAAGIFTPDLTSSKAVR